ncbi:hypothetical protein NDU88_004960 [Pleurodeles waltl]|uniref:Uncharacterized protein n=1 Tax=Pleurodeles waltl TaxID=8319 RepID=A0AAV7TU50_PLEWA|nr:hypothetical protein NDU88_004960 [Pleurodeles waltl]
MPSKGAIPRGRDLPGHNSPCRDRPVCGPKATGPRPSGWSRGTPLSGSRSPLLCHASGLPTAPSRPGGQPGSGPGPSTAHLRSTTARCPSVSKAPPTCASPASILWAHRCTPRGPAGRSHHRRTGQDRVGHRHAAAPGVCNYQLFRSGAVTSSLWTCRRYTFAHGPRARPPVTHRVWLIPIRASTLLHPAWGPDNPARFQAPPGWAAPTGCFRIFARHSGMVAPLTIGHHYGYVPGGSHGSPPPFSRPLFWISLLAALPPLLRGSHLVDVVPADQ